MKISFRNIAGNQKPVMQTQMEMKQHKSKKIPVFKIGGIILILLILGWGAFTKYRSSALYTYGIVAGDQDEVRAPFPMDIVKVMVRKGDVVPKGALLFTWVSTDGLEMIQTARQEAESLEQQVEEMNNKPPETLLKREMEIFLINTRGMQNRRRNDILVARLEIEKLSAIYLSRKKRHERITKLFKLNAATRSQVETADTESNLALANLNQASLYVQRLTDADRLESQKELSENQLYDQRITEEKFKTESRSQMLTRNLKASQIRLKALESKYDTTEYRSKFTAVIRDININEGSSVVTDKPLILAYSMNTIWVDAYAKPGDIKLLKGQKQVWVYSQETSSPYTGTLAGIPGIQVPLPEPLQEKIRETTTGLYFRVILKAGTDLIPGSIVKVIVK